MTKDDKKCKLKKKRPTSDQQYHGYPRAAPPPKNRKKQMPSTSAAAAAALVHDPINVPIPREANDDYILPQAEEDKEADGNHQDGDEGHDHGNDDNNNHKDDDDNNHNNDNDHNEGNEYKEDKDGDDNHIIHPTVQPTTTAKRRRVAQKVVPLQCSTRNGSKPRPSKRAKSTNLDTRKPKTTHINKNKDNNHDQKKGKKRQGSRSRRSRPISQFYFYSSDDDDEDNDDEDDNDNDDKDDDHHDVDDNEDPYRPSRSCSGVYGEVMCRVPCQFCASRFQHYPSLVSVGLSNVHGYGVFATQDIGNDTFLLQYVAREVPSHSTGFTLRYEGRLFEWEGTTGVHKFINHNCDRGPFEPNARFHPWRNQHDQEIISIISNRDIEKDEEIFIHFGKGFLWPKPCRCPNCIHHYDDRIYTKPGRRHSWPVTKQSMQNYS